MNSLPQKNLVVGHEDAFGVSLEPEDIAEMTSVKKIVGILQTKKYDCK